MTRATLLLCGVAALTPVLGLGCGGEHPEAPAQGAVSEAPPCPERMALLSDLGVCIDRFEARIEGSGSDARALSAESTLPASTASWDDAQAACAGAGFRLCRAVEWERACAGAEGRTYPYGDDYEVGRCNTSERESDLTTKHLSPGGSHARCVSPEGVYDLSGNIGEWVEDADQTGILRQLVGGAYANMGKYVRCHWDPPSYQPPDQRYEGQGFRCCTPARGAASRRSSNGARGAISRPSSNGEGASAETNSH